MLVIGILTIGTLSVIEDLAEEISVWQHINFSDNMSFEELDGNPSPCGEGGGGSSGGGGVPG